MAKLPRPRVVSKDDVGIDLPDEVSIALREIASTAKQGLLALSVGIGLAVVQEIFEEQATGIVGEKGKHDPGREANRHGHERRHLTLGGRKVPVRRPRVRSVAGGELALPAYELFASTDLLAEAAIGRMLAGLSTRRYRARLGARRRCRWRGHLPLGYLAAVREGHRGQARRGLLPRPLRP